MSETSGAPAPTRWILPIVIGIVSIAIYVNQWIGVVRHDPVVAIPAQPATPKNAYTIYMQAGRLVKHSNELMRYPYSPRGNRRRAFVNTTDLQHIMAGNQPTLALLRRGLTQQCRIPRSSVRNEWSNQISNLLCLPRLFAVERDLRLSRSDYNGAVASEIDRIAFVQSLLRGASVERLAWTLSMQVRNPPNQIDPVNRLSAPEALAARKRIEALISDRIRFADVLEEEKWYQLALRDAILSGKYNDGSNSNSMPTTTAAINQPRNSSTRSLLKRYSQHMDSCIQLARNSPDAVPAYPPDPTANSEPILASILSGQTSMGQAHGELLTFNSQVGSMLIRLALRSYFLDHGGYPSTLAELAPTYLTRVPLDPLGQTGQYAYQRVGGSFTLQPASLNRTAGAAP